MKVIYLKLAVILLVTYLFYGCSESTKSTNIGKRMVYICALADIVSWDTYSDLFSYDLESGELKKITTNIFSYPSGISKNGYMVFECSDEMHFGYWMLLSNNNWLSVPLPKSDNSIFDYEYSYPRIQLSYYGKTAVFGATLHNKRVVGVGISNLVFMNLQNLNHNVYDIENQLKNKFSSAEITDFIPARSTCILSNDGSTCWFVFSGRNEKDSSYSDLESRIFKSDGRSLQALSRIMKGDVYIIGADYINEKIFVRNIVNYDTTIFAVDNFNDSIPVNLPNEYFCNPEQFVKEKSEMAVWTDEGIAIYDLNTMTIKQNVLSWSKFDSLFPGYSRNKYKQVSISPDAEYLSFSLTGNYYYEGDDIFVIKRDGTELKRIAKQVLVWHISVSSVIQ